MTSDEYKTVIDTTHMMLGGYGRAIHPDDKKRLSDALAILENAQKAAAPQASNDLAIAVERAALYAASLKKADAENDALREDLRLAAETLRRYEVLHRAKGTDESTAKAEVNAALATRFEETLAAHGITSKAEGAQPAPPASYAQDCRMLTGAEFMRVWSPDLTTYGNALAACLKFAEVNGLTIKEQS